MRSAGRARRRRRHWQRATLFDREIFLRSCGPRSCWLVARLSSTDLSVVALERRGLRRAWFDLTAAAAAVKGPRGFICDVSKPDSTETRPLLESSSTIYCHITYVLWRKPRTCPPRTFHDSCLLGKLLQDRRQTLGALKSYLTTCLLLLVTYSRTLCGRHRTPNVKR